MATATTVRKGKLGKTELRLVEKDKHFFGMADGAVRAEGYNPDDVWRRLHDEAGKGDPKYFGFDGARNRFRHFFRSGFTSTNFVEQERQYKLKAKAKLEAILPFESASTVRGCGLALAPVFSLNMLFPQEQMRARDVLHSPDADSFIHGVAQLAAGDTNALRELAKLLKPYDCAKWTVVTLLPFLWRPDIHMFLKPNVTQDFSTRVGDRFAADYSSKLLPSVYESLLRLTTKTEEKISDLAPRDRIDIQSFIWVVGGYKEDEDPAQD